MSKKKDGLWFRGIGLLESTCNVLFFFYLFAKNRVFGDRERNTNSTTDFFGISRMNNNINILGQLLLIFKASSKWSLLMAMIGWRLLFQIFFRFFINPVNDKSSPTRCLIWLDQEVDGITVSLGLMLAVVFFYEINVKYWVLQLILCGLSTVLGG